MSENSVIPIRHSSLPGMVRLPSRYKPDRKRPDEIRKGSVGHNLEAIGMADRMSDLSQALLWLKQELIMMRQHDILLKRQFCDIHDTILTLCKAKRRAGFIGSKNVTSSNTSLHSNASVDISLENYGVRSASSVTLLNEEDEEEEDFVSFRPRTSSMKTTRDLAALARRRGSKELI